ncbi:MAG: hypothetical protein V3U14_10395 [candidate division NC10 bacterium]
MAKKLENLAKHVRAVLGERKRLEQIEKKLVSTLNKALGTIGYKVVSGKAPATGTPKRRRARRAKPAARPRRRTGARRRTVVRRRRARAKK